MRLSARYLHWLRTRWPAGKVSTSGTQGVHGAGSPAALMHMQACFIRFRIFGRKLKCISCNVCTSVCHRGIDVMNFPNKGEGMSDPECVCFSACVQRCPAGVLPFGRLSPTSAPIFDRLAASPAASRNH